MYPNFYFLFQDLFGISLPFLKIINTFGFMVAISFIAAHVVMSLELKRKHSLGLLPSSFKKQITGQKFPLSDYVISGVTGFVVGLKLYTLLFDFASVESDPQAFILSLQGNPYTGLLFAALSVAYTYFQDKRQRLDEPVITDVEIQPQHHMSVLTVAAFIAGILGAKLFHILENLDEFKANPVESITAFSGLTFYGGLICGGAAVLYYANKYGIKPLYMLDAGGPAMMLAYGLGRVGCHVAGDGDWGIVNTAPKPDWMGWAPNWLWSYNYPNNVNHDCNPYVEGTKEYLANINCNFKDTPYLVANVFPTPLYEVIACLLLFFILWRIRKRIIVPGVLFGIYLMMNGVERFLIEQIRVNSIISFLGMKVTQAEVISVILFLAGIAIIVYSYRRYKHQKTTSADTGPQPTA